MTAYGFCARSVCAAATVAVAVVLVVVVDMMFVVQWLQASLAPRLAWDELATLVAAVRKGAKSSAHKATRVEQLLAELLRARAAEEATYAQLTLSEVRRDRRLRSSLAVYL